jgi:Txe/YoeB family toxin of toxin-antitoxin system
VPWRLVFTKQARKDAKKIAHSGLQPQAEGLLEILKEDPYQTPPPYEKLLGDLSKACSRRINIQHRLVYQILLVDKNISIMLSYNQIDRWRSWYAVGNCIAKISSRYTENSEESIEAPSGAEDAGHRI